MKKVKNCPPSPSPLPDSLAPVYVNEGEAYDLEGELSRVYVSSTSPDRRPQPIKVDTTHLTDRRGRQIEMVSRRKDRYDFIGELPFMVINLSLFKVLYEKRVRGEARSVLDWLISHVETDNIVTEALQKDIASDARISQPNVSNAMAFLEDMDLILKGKAGTVWLNPRYVFLGLPQDQRRCCKAWDRRKAEKAAARREKMGVVAGAVAAVEATA